MKEGQTACFELELSHENVPVTWFRNDMKIHPSRTVLMHMDRKKHILEMKEVTLDDTCQIKAEAKGIPSMANLTVIGNKTSIFPFSSYPYSPPQSLKYLLTCEVLFVCRC